VFFSLINLIRLIFILIFVAPFFLINKEKAIYFFFNFAGPSFIKLGQLLSVRADLVGKQVALTLTKFQDCLKPFSHKKVINILHQEFGDDFDKIFKEFNFTPVASASIAQVHKARLHNDLEVAVKILRPNIHKTMMRDISTLRLLTKICYLFSKFLAKTFKDVGDLLDQTAIYELDLLHEGANGSKLHDDMIGAKGFYVPQIFWQYSSTKILVIEWIDGIPFSNSEAIANCKFDKKILAENLVLSYFRQVYVHGFFHADMHPGNLFLKENGDIAVVDFGIMGKIDRKTRIAVAEVLIGFLHRQYRHVAEIHIKAGFVPANTNIDDLALSCRKIGEMIVGANVIDISIAKLLTSLIEMTREYQMETKPELLLLQKTLMLVEGVGVTLDPDLNIWDLARPWVKEWAKTNIGVDAKIRDALSDLLGLAKKFIKEIENKIL
jgi:ubiquinone biosynthesis protein